MKSIYLLLFIMATVTSCKKDNKTFSKKNVTEAKFELPKDTSNLWIREGSKSNDTVLIFCQGGPKDYLNFEKDGKTSWRYLKNYGNYYKIHLHQSNTLNPDFYKLDSGFDYELAKLEIEKSSEILHRAITYFKQKDKVVYILANSFGSYILQYYLSFNSSLADKYIIVSARVEEQKLTHETFKKGLNGHFENGITFIPSSKDDISDYTKEELEFYKARQLLKAALGAHNYIDLLSNVDLSNVIYIFNPTDTRVGGLNAREQNFLEEKGVTVYATKHPHGASIFGLVDGMDEGKISF